MGLPSRDFGKEAQNLMDCTKRYGQNKANKPSSGRTAKQGYQSRQKTGCFLCCACGKKQPVFSRLGLY